MNTVVHHLAENRAVVLWEPCVLLQKSKLTERMLTLGLIGVTGTLAVIMKSSGSGRLVN